MTSCGVTCTHTADWARGVVQIRIVLIIGSWCSGTHHVCGGSSGRGSGSPVIIICVVGTRIRVRLVMSPVIAVTISVICVIATDGRFDFVHNRRHLVVWNSELASLCIRYCDRVRTYMPSGLTEATPLDPRHRKSAFRLYNGPHVATLTSMLTHAAV